MPVESNYVGTGKDLSRQGDSESDRYTDGQVWAPGCVESGISGSIREYQEFIKIRDGGITEGSLISGNQDQGWGYQVPSLISLIQHS